ncbi:MAG TPA: hypothetical protein VLF66_01250, partial [Thermoanaerobaculia bacterium]|nr:hypothetical protein [Thermoanaerobaculia bacterium]
KFDEIVAFAEVERFLDTQVKHYSSGMYLRLAFAVAAHLEPEVLLIDEVLAVGDASFQRKCLGKMSDVARLGRTVLFVSHNLAAVSRLCDRCILLERGRLAADGAPAEVIRAYSELIGEERGAGPRPLEAAAPLALREVRLEGGEEVLHAGRPWAIAFTVEAARALAGLTVGVALLDDQGRLVLHSRLASEAVPALREPGSHRVRLAFPPVYPAPGLYSLEIKLVGEGLGSKCRVVNDPRTVQVVNDELDHLSLPGAICPPCEWRVEPAEAAEPAAARAKEA